MTTLRDIIEIVEAAKGRGFSLEDEVIIKRETNKGERDWFEIANVECSGTHHGRIIFLTVKA